MAKIILKESIRKLGKIGDIVTVKNGYAFNFLVPQKKAMPATAENLAALEKQKEQMVIDDQKKKDLALSVAKQIPSELFLARPVNENGLLYGSIAAKDIFDEIKVITDKHSIHFKNHIHKYGVYTVEIELHHDVVINLVLSISDNIENAKKQVAEVNNAKKVKKVKKKDEGEENQEKIPDETTQSS